MKKSALVIFKILVAAILLWYIFTYKINPAKLWPEIKRADLGWLALALAVNFSVIFLAVWRWNLLLLAQGIRTRFHPLFWTTCAGNFFNSFLLGLTGGDLARIYYATQLAPSKKVGAGLSVAVDRIVGMLGLMTLAGIVIAIFGRGFWANEDTRKAVQAILAAIVFSALFILIFLKQGMISHWIRLEKWLHRLPFQKVLNHLRQINEAYLNDRSTLLKTVLISVVVHIFSILSVWLIGKSLKIEASIIHYYLVMPIVNGVSAIPISPGSLGVRENMFLLMFNAVGVTSDEKVIAMSLIYFGVIVLSSLICGLIYLVAKPTTMHLEKISEIIAHEETGTEN